jgi:GWxTD domain-containing protein
VSFPGLNFLEGADKMLDMGRTMKKLIFSILAINFMLSQAWVQAETATQGALPDRYRKWLTEEVVYIITPSEREVFLKLKTDRERDLLIEAFWKHRQPTPGAAENSFKTEHYRRLNYANTYYGRSSPKPGWQTDRGRTYIILGEPRDIERFTGESEIYNAEVWFYQGLTQLGLPPGFNLMFFQRGGTGDYVLYSPVSDGPQALLPTYFGDQANSLQAYKQLKQAQPNLATVAISLIPGESSPFGQPSLASEILIQNVYSVPQRQFKDTYAEKLLLYKDIVEVDYSANYIESDSLVAVLQDPSGLYFVNYLLELKKLSLAGDRDTYSTQLILNGNVTDQKGKSIFQFENSIPLKLTEDELKKVAYNPFDIQEMFPLIPGQYRLSILLKNEVSKEFTSMEKAITIPEVESAPRIGPLLLGFRTTHDVPGTEKATKLVPFRLGAQRVYCQPRAMFLTTDKMILAFQALGLTPGLRQRGKLKYEIFKEEEPVYSVEEKLSDYPDKLNCVEEFSMEDFLPAYYRIRVSLADGPDVLSAGEERFEVTSVASFPRPWNHSRSLAGSEESIYPLMLGRQYVNAGEKEKARAQFEKVYQDPPASLPYAMNLASGFFELGDYQKAVKLLTPFSEKTDEHYDVFFMLGRSHQALGDCAQALAFYQKAFSHFGANILLLNCLGECHLKLGHKEEAISAWKKSLELNPQQPELKAQMDALKEHDR